MYLRVATNEINAKDHSIGRGVISSCQDGHCFLIELESIWHYMSSSRIWVQQSLQDLGGLLGLALLFILKVFIDALSTHLRDGPNHLSAQY